MKINLRLVTTTLLLAMLISFQQQTWARPKAKPIELKGPLKSEMTVLLKKVEELHDACIKKSELKIAQALTKTQKELTRVRAKSASVGAQKTHLEKILNAAERAVERAKAQNGQARKNSLRDAFLQLVQLVRLYDFKEYKIFFCHKDKVTWIQKSAKPKNPINPDKFLDCGKLGT